MIGWFRLTSAIGTGKSYPLIVSGGYPTKYKMN
jgi:hypothetical protein